MEISIFNFYCLLVLKWTKILCLLSTGVNSLTIYFLLGSLFACEINLYYILLMSKTKKVTAIWKHFSVLIHKIPLVNVSIFKMNTVKVKHKTKQNKAAKSLCWLNSIAVFICKCIFPIVRKVVIINCLCLNKTWIFLTVSIKDQKRKLRKIKYPFVPNATFPRDKHGVLMMKEQISSLTL
jgi:hypothetical protein